MKIGRFFLPAAGLMLLAALALTPAPQARADEIGDRLAVKRAAAKIDKLVEDALRARGLKPNGLADDETFCRRTYLAIVGRIPTKDELERFKRSRSSDKWHDLVDELQGARGRESHLFNWWADLLRTRSRLPRRISGEPYIHWLKQSIADNKPYDEMVRELLTATGPVHERGNGATGYLMRDRNMPEDNMSNTIRLFLGSRLECAQCHNHPFDKWTQKQYFQMVAFTGGIRYQKNGRRDPRARRLAQEARQRWGRNGLRALRRTMLGVYDGIYGSGTGAVRLPKDYQYDDAEPFDWIVAEPLFDPHIDVQARLPDTKALERRLRRRRMNPQRRERILRRQSAKEVGTRATFAGWMTSPDNDRFAKVIANRVWKRLFGRGLIEPVDDIRDRTAAVAPELMDELERLIVAVGFDLKAFERTLLYTRLWRREAGVPAEVPGDVADLRGPLLRRMTAEQAWDSLLTLVVPDLDRRLQSPGDRAERVYSEYEKLANSDEEVMARTGRLVLRYTDSEKFRQQRRAERRQRAAEMREERRKARTLFRELKKAQREGDLERAAELEAELEERGLLRPGARAGRALRDLQRASDLPSPAPAGHLLRELGQSQRDLIDAGHTDPTVPQVLALMNSFLERRLLRNKTSVLAREIDAERGARDRVETAFLAVLGRSPTSRERSTWTRDLARGGDKAVQDLVWTLVNSHEFLFIQ